MFFYYFFGKNDLLEEEYPNWMMMIWAITLFSSLAYKYYINKGKAVNFTNMFGLSFLFQFILVVIHLLLYKSYSSLRGDAIFGGCSDCGPKLYFWLSASANFILLFLTYKWKKMISVFKNKGISHTAEIDFLIQYQNRIIPIEVKAAENFEAKSFKTYHLKFSPEISIRTSLSNYRKEDWLVNLPLYACSSFIE